MASYRAIIPCALLIAGVSFFLPAQYQPGGSGAVTGGNCTNQVATAISTKGAPTCSAVTGAMTSGTTGSGNFVLATSPTLVTPTLGAATATTINGTAIPSSTTLITPNTDIFSSSKPMGTIGSQTTKNLSINNGATGTLLSQVSGSGYISEIFIATNRYGVEVIITVDGEQGTPALDLNLADFLGDTYLDTQPTFRGQWITGSNSGSNNLGGLFRLPIPFSTSVKVELKNNSGSGALVTTHVIYHTGIANTWTRTQKLYAAVASAGSIAANAETNMVNVTPNKKGRLAGFGWIYDGFPGSATPRDAPLEGAFKMYFEGSGTAGYAVAGSEDMFGMGWYFANFTSFGAASTGTLSPSSGDIILTIKNANTWGAQRFFILDPITFENAFRMTWICGNTSAVNFTGTCTLKSTVFYYTEL